MRSEKLIAKLGAWIRSAAIKSSRDPGTQDDLTQEGMVVLIELSLRYKKIKVEDLVNMAVRAVRNRFIDLARRAQARIRREEGACRPEQAIVTWSNRPEVRECLEFVRSRLDDSDREVVDLSLDGLSPNEIAIVQQRGRASVYRAMKRIVEERPN